ncbi:pseudouridine synthase, partial [uncultured Selenomonas sp.]|uniref:pseudouridine synthase n=1 Tax=uncultured Selenomonas sp. TaxID=159275 RepID=UPI002583F72E
GYLSTAKDERGRRTVLDLLPEVTERIYPEGRLDNNTEGLLLLTNDGTLMNGLLHPRYQVEKTYIARVAPPPPEAALITLTEGVELSDGKTAPALVRVIERDPAQARVEITIHEGRNRQVRRMFEAVGSDVRALKRVAFARLTLAGVRRGAHRPLTAAEVAQLYELAGVER